jgi:hypothetical protein
VARISIARKQKRKAKTKARKIVRRRAMPASIKVLDTRRPADVARPKDETETATGVEAGQDHHQRRGTIRAPASPVSEAYSHAMGSAMQALQSLLALPFIGLQIWQNAIFGRLER